MKTPIVVITAEHIYLSTSLSSDAFGRTQYTREIDEKGFVATVPLETTDYTDVSFSDWNCTGTQVDEHDTAFFVGNSLGAGKTLYTVFETASEQEKKTSAFAVCKALSVALAQHIPLQAIGAEGICLFTKKQCVQVLFLPANLFDRAAANTKNSYADFQGYYIRKGLESAESLLFTRAVIAYRALCGVLPYSNADTSQRQADIFDAQFTPSYMLINGLDAEVSSTIDCGLQVSAEARPLPGERRFVNEKEIEKRKKILAAAQKFSLAAFKSELQKSVRTPELPDDVFSKRRNDFIKKQSARIRRNRFIRRNHHRIVVGSIAGLLGIWAITSFTKENQTLATSKGLDSWQTTQALYATVHKSDVPDLQELAKGKHTKNLRQIVSGFYVTNKSRYAMNQDDGTVNPAEWLHLKNKTQYWQYGLTHLHIDGVPADPAFAYPTRADKPQRLAAEPGITLKSGATTQHTAEYFLVNNNGSARITINSVTDTVTLTWKYNRWIVTDIQSKSKSSFVFTKDFYADYQAALEATNGDVPQAAALLRETYAWIPSDAEVRQAAETIQQTFRLTNLQKMSD